MKSALWISNVYRLPSRLIYYLGLILPEGVGMFQSRNVEAEVAKLLDEGFNSEGSTAARKYLEGQAEKERTALEDASQVKPGDSPHILIDKTTIADSSPTRELPYGFKPAHVPSTTKNLIHVDMVHRLREGGVLIYFENEELRDEAQSILIRGFLNARPVFKVLGTPYVDDLILKTVSSRLRVDYETDAMNVEDQLFEAFRHYGRITNIAVDRKTKIAYLSYTTSRNAVAAKSCLHGAKVLGTGRVVVHYEAFSRFKWFAEMSKSPKMIPLFAILISIILVLMVEPVRLLNVIQKLAAKQATDHPIQEQTSVREQAEESLEDLFSQNSGIIFLITGSSGTGKSTMLQNIVNRRKYAALISCLKQTTYNAQQDETSLIERLEEGLNFSPSFSKVNSVISYIEAFLPKSTNSMTSSNLQQLQNILRTLDNSLKILSSMYPSRAGQQYPYSLIVFDQFHELVKELEYTNDGGKAQQLFDTIMNWANEVTKKKTANVVFVCDNSLAIETFKKYKNMRSKCSTIHVLDLSRDQAGEFLRFQLRKQPLVHKVKPEDNRSEKKLERVTFFDILKYVWRQRISRLFFLGGPQMETKTNHLEDVNIPQEAVDKVVDILGGRLSDLLSLTERISRDFETVDSALEEMIKDAKQHILKTAFGPKFFVIDTGKQWTQIQMWKTISAIAQNVEIPMDTVLYDILEGDEKALNGLVHSNILGIDYRSDKVNQYYITAFSPLYLQAFQLLTKDPFFSKGMKKLMFDESVKSINTEIKGIEEEMHLLRTQSGGSGLRVRMGYLNQKLEDATNRLIMAQEKYQEEQSKV